MKIGIVGNYGHDNNGDEAILEGILSQLSKDGVEKEDIVIFSNNPENTRKRYSIQSFPLIHKKGSLPASVAATLVEHGKKVRQLDVLIMGGGGVLMDMFKRDAPLYSSIVFMAKLMRCKVLIYGVGAGPIETKLGTFLIKRMINSSSLTAVRDEESRQLLETKGITKEIHVIPDPALSLGKSTDKKKTEEIKRVGVTAVPYFSSSYWPVSDESVYQSYIVNMAESLDRLIENHRVEVVFFSTKYPQDVGVTKDIRDKMKHVDSTVIDERNLTPIELINLSMDLDIVIGTRLHSLILSVAAGTPIIGIGYHKKVFSFLKRMDYLDNYLSMENLSNEENLSKVVFSMKTNWQSVQEQMIRVSQEYKEDTMKASKLMEPYIKGKQKA
jgi:polysaccharide pyruvyl transferase CsaB